MTDLDHHLAALREATDDASASNELKGRLLDLALQSAPSRASQRLADRRAAKTLWSRVKLRWSEVPQGGRQLAIVMVLLMLVPAGARMVIAIATIGKAGGALAAFADDSKTVFEVESGPTKDCFGLGSGVTHTTADKAQFSFNFPVTAKKAIATLRFTAGQVAKSEEVDISVGAVHQGFVNRSFGDDQRAQEVPLASKYLKPNDKNNIVFDNLKNPPGQETWVICNVAVEVQQLPAGTESELREYARADILNGDRFYQDRLIAAPNRYNAWRSYKRALLYLEAMESRIDEYDVVKQKIRDTEREMDEDCSKIMLNGAAAEKQNKITDAISQYKHGLQFFPERDFACYATIHSRLDELQ
jgi:hypothetical protein